MSRFESRFKGSTRGLMIRLDRLGDLVLTLPVDQHPDLHSAQVTWVINQNNSFLIEAAEPYRNFLGLDPKSSESSAQLLTQWIEKNRPDWAVVFHAPFWVYRVLFFCRVPVRGGPLSRWYSWLLLNCGIRQKRSEALKNECEYNQELLERSLGLRPLPKLSPLRLKAKSTQKFTTARPYVVVHPGMGGSARNWSIENYLTTIRELVAKGRDVIITGTPMDEPYVGPMRSSLTGEPHVHFLDGKLSGSDLLGILAQASAVLAPSTGVVHLAASLGVPTVGIYCPVRVQAPRRWGPQGERVRVLVPEVTCPGHFSCLMQKCPQFDCMTLIQPEMVVKLLRGGE